jgi:5S rRNA maturation endonuclease (ribonuclease M5)
MTTPTDALQQVLDRLPGHKGNGDKWTAFCPCHENPPTGHKPSLSIARGDNGRVLVHCLGGCATADVVKALGLEMTDLFADAPPHVKHRPRAPTSVTAGPATPSFAPTRQFVTAYPYHGACGHLLFEVCRYNPKDFKQRRPDGSGAHVWNLDGVPRVLYRLPQVLAADPAAWVFVCEGEKDCDALAALGLVATCNPGGANKWVHLAHDSALYGRRVCIIVDKDKEGRRHAQDVARRLYGKAAEIRLLEMPDAPTIDTWKSDPVKIKDAADWVEAHDGQDAEALAALLLALAETAPRYSPPTDAQPQDSPDDAEAEHGVFVRLSDVAPQPVRWLWPGRIALGKLCIEAGPPGLGKSCISLDLAARVTRGDGWPDDPLSTAEPGGVLILSAEDDLADTIVPRLNAAGADLSRVLALTTIKRFDPQRGREVFESFNLATHLPILESGIAQVGNCRLAIIDPLSAFLGGADSHNDGEVRGLLAPLAFLAARYHVAILGISHLNKGHGDAVTRVMGSIGFVAAPRHVFAVTKDREDPSRRLFLPVKNNLGIDNTGFAYRLIVGVGGVPRVSWESAPVAVSADDAVAPVDQRRGPEPENREEAQSWLVDFLAGGPRPAEECLAEASRVLITRATLRRAKAAAGVIAEKQSGVSDGPWMWRLPGHETLAQPNKIEGAQVPLSQAT